MKNFIVAWIISGLIFSSIWGFEEIEYKAYGKSTEAHHEIFKQEFWSASGKSIIVGVILGPIIAGVVFAPIIVKMNREILSKGEK